MDLYLVRHGRAEKGVDDALRPLSEEGREAGRRISDWLGRHAVRVDRLQHSPLLRAAQTANILSPAVGGALGVRSGLRPEDDVVPLAREMVGGLDERLMLVGHLPFMERLAAYLLTQDPERPLLHFRTGAVAHLSYAHGVWTLEWFISPSLV